LTPDGSSDRQRNEPARHALDRRWSLAAIVATPIAFHAIFVFQLFGRQGRTIETEFHPQASINGPIPD
jgi:hypothetical protein